ncbi:MAG TPA: hypothetical protein VKW78_04580 [Terriglobales bacterium]|nr:hypothetical protein [Terriglobales bacterium]
MDSPQFILLLGILFGMITLCYIVDYFLVDRGHSIDKIIVSPDVHETDLKRAA